MEHYFSGVISTVLSTPCTAPFLGSAMFFSFQSSGLFIFTIFNFIAIGFCTPYLLLLMWPSLLKFLPKSGKWLNKLKLFLIILLICTLMWLLGILNSQLGFRVALGLFLLLLLIKFVLENSLSIFKKTIIKFTVLTSLVFFSFSLSSLFKSTNDGYIDEAKNLWHQFAPDKIEQLINSGKIVFIDITADWCITCKYNKYFALNSSRVIKILSDERVVAMRGDFTNYNPAINDFLAKQKIHGIPYNVIFSSAHPKGIMLPVVLSIKDVEQAFESSFSHVVSLTP